MVRMENLKKKIKDIHSINNNRKWFINITYIELGFRNKIICQTYLHSLKQRMSSTRSLRIFYVFIGNYSY